MTNQDSKETIDALDRVNRSEKVEPSRKAPNRYALLLIQLPNVSRSSSVSPSQMRAAIEKLGQGTPKAGPSGVLRVLISNPAGFNLIKTLSQATQGKPPTQLIATVDLAKLVEQLLGSGTQRALALRRENVKTLRQVDALNNASHNLTSTGSITLSSVQLEAKQDTGYSPLHARASGSSSPYPFAGTLHTETFKLFRLPIFFSSSNEQCIENFSSICLYPHTV